MNALFEKFREVIFSVVPIVLIVFILNVTIAPVETELFLRFILGAIFIILGLGIFLWGIDLGISEIGTLVGNMTAHFDAKWKVFIVGFFLGFMITVAEPDLLILANQIVSAMGGTLHPFVIVGVVSVGVGFMVGLGLLRILTDFPLSKFLTIGYFIAFFLMIFVSDEFRAISFDASGATTGAMTTPFLLALCFGVSSLKGSTDSEKDSFGLVGIASLGPILAILIFSFFNAPGNAASDGAVEAIPDGILGPLVETFRHTVVEGLMALLPIVLVFYFLHAVKLRVKKKELRKINKGILYTYLGLVIFLTGVNSGFMDMARVMGRELAAHQSNFLLPLVGLILGMVVVLAEPAVYVLSNQVEEITGGSISKRMILVCLSIGVSLAVAISMIRIQVESLKLWMFIVPGFSLALFAARKVPDIFVGIAFDAGGVASGPMTATFILALAQGACESIPTADVLLDGFGVIAMVAMMPIVSILILGFMYQRKINQVGAYE